MQENWAIIDEFPGYEVSDLGRVRAAKTGRILQAHPNAQGFYKVSLYAPNGRSFTRAVPFLVLDAFDPDPKPWDNSVIHKNNDRSDSSLENLARRPRSYAIKYHQQFGDPEFLRPDCARFRVHGETRIYSGFPEICVRFGILYGDLLVGAFNKETIYPPGVRIDIL